jgi:hypothetical protein
MSEHLSSSKGTPSHRVGKGRCRCDVPVDDEKRLKIRNFRKSDEDWSVLEAHFKEKRIQPGSGIRMVLVEYFREEGLLK